MVYMVGGLGRGVVGTYLLFHVFPFVESSLISGKLIAPVVVLTNIALGRYAFYFKKRRIKWPNEIGQKEAGSYFDWKTTKPHRSWRLVQLLWLMKKKARLVLLDVWSARSCQHSSYRGPIVSYCPKESIDLNAQKLNEFKYLSIRWTGWWDDWTDLSRWWDKSSESSWNRWALNPCAIQRDRTNKSPQYCTRAWHWCLTRSGESWRSLAFGISSTNWDWEWWDSWQSAWLLRKRSFEYSNHNMDRSCKYYKHSSVYIEADWLGTWTPRLQRTMSFPNYIKLWKKEDELLNWVLVTLGQLKSG